MLRSCWHLPAQVALSFVIVFPSYAELTVLPGDLLEISDISVIDNFDLINNQGEIINNGVIQNYYNSVFSNSGLVSNYGSTYFEMGSELRNYLNFDNYGYLRFYDARFLNTGSFNNLGGLIELTYADLALNTGTFNNDGLVMGGQGSVFNNAGVLNNNQDLVINVNNSGTLNNNAVVDADEYVVNQASAILNNSVTGVIEASRIDNNGEFNSQGGIILFDGYAYGTGSYYSAEINNSGLFNQDGFIEDYSSNGLSIINSGEFNNNGFINTVNQIQIQNSGVFNQNVILDVYSYQQSVIRNSGLFNNNAGIFGFGRLENSGTFENVNALDIHGELWNQSSGVFNNTPSGSVAVTGVLNNQGQFNNQSLITMFENFDPVTGIYGPARLDNSGVFNHDGAIDAVTGEGLRVNNFGEFNNNGQFASYGDIRIYNTGVFNHNVWFGGGSGQQDEIINDGTFNNIGGLDYVENIRNSGSFNNSAGIYASEHVENSGVFENNSLLHLFGELINQATGVINNLLGGYVDVTGTLDNRGEFNNQSSIFLSEFYDPATGIINPAMLNNSGVFNHNGSIDVYSNQGLVLNNTGTFYNNGNFNASGGLILNNMGNFENNTWLDLSRSQNDRITNTGVFSNNYDINGIEFIENTGAFQNIGSMSVYGQMINRASGIFNNDGFASLDGMLDNQGEFNNRIMLDLNDGFDPTSGMLVSAVLNNSGTFNNTELGIITANGGLVLNNSGIFNQFGQFNGDYNIVINNHGTFNNGAYPYSNVLNLGQDSRLNNYGTFNNRSGIDGLYGWNSQLTNTGVFNNESIISSVQQISNSGTLNNRGNITIDYMQSLVNQNAGVINNFDPNYSSVVIRNNGTLDNQGTINNESGSRIELGYGSATNNSGTIVNNGDISGPGNFNNTGTVVNNNMMQGLGSITTSGELVNNGFLMAENVQVTGGLFKGNGYIDVLNGMVITEAGTLAPGNSTGFMSISGDLFLDGALEMEFDWSSVYLHDQLDVQGNVVLGADSVLDISLLGSDYFSIGQTFDLISASDIIGDFGSFYYDALFDQGLALQWQVLNEYGRDILRLSVVSAVPLPAAVWLLLSGLLGMMTVARRKRVLH